MQAASRRQSAQWCVRSSVLKPRSSSAGFMAVCLAQCSAWLMPITLGGTLLVFCLVAYAVVSFF